MGDIETAVRYSKEIESLLEKQFGAEGRGLHEKASSVEQHLPSEMFNKLRYIASVRNKVVHEAGYQIDDRDAFVASCEEALSSLRTREPSHSLLSNPNTLEAKVRRFLLSLATPSAIFFSLIGGGLAWYGIGIGAAIAASLLGAFIGYKLFSDGAIEFYINTFYLAVGLAVLFVVLATISALWGIGRLSS